MVAIKAKTGPGYSLTAGKIAKKVSKNVSTRSKAAVAQAYKEAKGDLVKVSLNKAGITDKYQRGLLEELMLKSSGSPAIEGLAQRIDALVNDGKISAGGIRHLISALMEFKRLPMDKEWVRNSAADIIGILKNLAVAKTHPALRAHAENVEAIKYCTALMNSPRGKSLSRRLSPQEREEYVSLLDKGGVEEIIAFLHKHGARLQ